jgi:hypothetical protein
MAWGDRKPEGNDKDSSCLQASDPPRPFALVRSAARCKEDEFVIFGTRMFVGASNRLEG